MTFQGKKNIYTCEECREHIVTIDIDEGVTPYMTSCRCTPACRGMMKSSMYRVDQLMRPSWEWFHPASFDGLSAHTEEHVAKGGLVLRRAADAMPLSLGPPTHRHKKRGSTYTLLGIGKMQAEKWVYEYELRPDHFECRSADMHEVAVYRSTDDGSLWVRPREEFEDGRFEDIRGIKS